MYTEAEYSAIRAQLKKRLFLLLAPSAALFVCAVWALARRQQPLAIAAAMICGIALIFFTEMTIRPLWAYRRHLDAMLHGITHEERCVFRSFEPDVSMVEGVSFRTMNVTCVDDQGKPYERFFYYDCEKPLPEWTEGTPIRVTYHDRSVASAEALPG